MPARSSDLITFYRNRHTEHAKRFDCSMKRRRFLEGCTSGLAALCAASPCGHAACAGSVRAPREVAADVVIVGGGLGGCAAALAALENNLRVVLTEPFDWIGGQLTAQAVPPDEHHWIEQLGRNARYQKLRQGIRDHYRRHYPLTAEAQAGNRSALMHQERSGGSYCQTESESEQYVELGKGQEFGFGLVFPVP